MRSEKTEAKLIIVFKTSQLKARNEHRLIINALQHDTVMIRGCHVCWGREYARSNDWCVCVYVCTVMMWAVNITPGCCVACTSVVFVLAVDDIIQWQ